MQLEERQIESYENAIQLETVRRILNLNPLVHIGGSVALYLHGIYLKRIYNQSLPVDFDLCVPYYTPLVGLPTDKVAVSEEHGRTSDSDYEEVLTFNGIKVDYRVAPAEPFEVVTLGGFHFRVTPLEIIMEAKFRYAMHKSKKHREDCYEICGKKPPLEMAVPEPPPAPVEAPADRLSELEYIQPAPAPTIYPPDKDIDWGLPF